MPQDNPSVRPVAVIVAHGQPSDPAPAEAEIAELAARVAALVPEIDVRSATLATDGALAVAVSGAERVVVYPLFMADGWFTETHLPSRLIAAGADEVCRLAPFGLDPAVQDLTLALAAEAAARIGLPPHRASVLLAAHGSFRSDAPAAVARAMAARIAAEGGFAKVEPAFIEQTPRIADVARGFGAATICLPFFAARGGHVTEDLPAALAEAGFAGQLVDPVGLDHRVPGLIAATLRAAIG
ncbi:MAG: cobalamin biosynthesis protein CbiX [Cereibacter sphaeroides]|uniref:Cobalamin biosynthesis protein CbiX n=1 Tax=Cereibacter sphaeroides TaxID=1063 RepID=A0A2W5SBH5_CERSP|nr:MAG: cobalamin biosynthesis protein CbiX [Cereibacter sphaeroides]